MAQFTDSQWNEIFAEVTRRATVDADFRALALRDATAAMRAVTNKSLPSNVVVRFVDNSGTTKTIPLPAAIPEVEELSELDLEQVAGGDVSVGWRR
jgi:3-methyladenine DNA glycosylase AlkC